MSDNLVPIVYDVAVKIVIGTPNSNPYIRATPIFKLADAVSMIIATHMIYDKKDWIEASRLVAPHVSEKLCVFWETWFTDCKGFYTNKRNQFDAHICGYSMQSVIAKHVTVARGGCNSSFIIPYNHGSFEISYNCTFRLQPASYQDFHWHQWHNYEPRMADGYRLWSKIQSMLTSQNECEEFEPQLAINDILPYKSN